MHPESEGAVPGLRAGAAGCAADSAWQDEEAGTARHADVSGAGNCPQAGEPPPPLLGLHPSGGEAAAPATHAAAPLHEPHWHGRLESPQDHAISGSRAGAGLPRTPSYPSTDPSTLTATISPGGGWLAGFKRALRKLKRDVKALNYAVQDPRVGFLPRLLALLTIAYLLSPLDLLPDIIPVIGLLDDLIIVPALLMLAVWLIPDDVMADARERAEREPLRLRNNWAVACVFFAMWDALLVALVWWAIKRFGGPELKHWRWWVVGGTALLLAAGEAAWSWVRYRREVQQEAERAAARLARMRARARYAACCAAAAERVWPDAAPAALPPPLPPLVPLPVERGPAVAPAPRAAAAVGKGAGGVDDELKAALLAEQWEP